MACAHCGSPPAPPHRSAGGNYLSSGGEFLMLDLILILGITLSAAGFVGALFMHRQRPCREEDASVSSSAGLLLQKDTLYTAIRDLEFDLQTGKVDQKDYAELRQQLEREAVHVLRLLDALDPCTALDAALEQQIALLRQRPTAIAREEKYGIKP